MKSQIVFLMLLAGLFQPVTSQADPLVTNDTGYMQGHPAYNDSYYNYDYNTKPDAPNYDIDYYNRRTNTSISRDDDDNRPHGTDIRDYNPYYDRYGNLKIN